jgi:hypothetical protein
LSFFTFPHCCSAKGCLKDFSLPVKMMHPDSINNIEIYAMIGQQLERDINIGKSGEDVWGSCRGQRYRDGMRWKI